MSLIVKHFINDEHDGGHDDRDILNQGKQVLKHACTQAGWVTVAPPSHAQLVCFQRTNNAYTYALSPPSVDLAFRDEVLLDFDTSKPVEEEVIVLEDLEEFNHDPNSFPDIDNPSQEQGDPQLSAEDYSLFFQQHQPEAQSTPVQNNGTGLSSLDVSLFLKQAESILQQVPSLTAGDAPGEVSPRDVVEQPTTELPDTTSTASGEGSHVHWEESLRNHSAFTPPDGWSQQDTPSMHPPSLSGNASQKNSGSHFFTGSQPPSNHSLSQSAVASEHQSNNISFSLPPPAQAPHNNNTIPESTPPSFSFDANAHHPPLPLPLPSQTRSHSQPHSYSQPHSQVQSQHRHATPSFSSQHHHATPSFSSQHPPTPTHNPESLGSPIYSYSGPNREPTPTPSIPRSQLEQYTYSSQYPRLYDPVSLREDLQVQPVPEAYMPLPEMGSLSLEAPSASQEGEGASQPSAYNDQPPASRVHPADVVFASVAYNYSSATPPPPGQPPPPRSASSQPYFDWNVPVPSANHGTSESIDAGELGEIPGFGTRPPPKHDTAREEGGVDRSSSPIQDFTTSIVSARPNLNVQPVGDFVGQIPGFCTRPPQHLVSSDARQEADEPRRSSSPIQDFTTSIVSARPSAQPVDEPVGPRWKFPSDAVRAPQRGKHDGGGEGGEGMRDVTSSSPILDFTTTASALDMDLVGGGLGANTGHDESPPGFKGGGGEMWRVPGLQQSPSQSLPQSQVQKETGLGLSGIAPEDELAKSIILKPANEATSESVQIRTGEGAQPRETWSGGGSESFELYGNQQADDGRPQSLGVVGREMDVDPPQPGGGEQKPLTRMSTDEQLYGSSGKSLPDVDDGDGGKTPTQEQPQEALHRPDSTNSGASSKRSRSPDARGASAHIQRVEEGTVSPPRKRRRLESGALYDMIPGPHLYTVPSPPATPAPKTLKLPEEANPKAYTALNLPQFLPLSEHTPDSVAQLFKDPYARCAWIIPVRGVPPFPGCTAASVLDTSPSPTSHPTSTSNTLISDKVTDLPSGPTSNVAHQDSPGAITWTGDALRAFWKFLVDVREAGQMGPVALSFHCASSCYAGSSSSRSKSNARERTDGARLRDIDFFKVYVDAPYAPKMRDLLHAWRYECTVGGETVRWRLLRGAKFVLVDERSKGVLVW